MSDHVDGPRQIGDPPADLTDLFAFTSPENASHTVVAANVFPSAGVTAMFSNAVNHSIVIRRVSVAGVGDSSGFKPGDKEHRFSCRFSVLEPGADSKPVQRGTLTCPDGQVLTFVVNDEKGASTPDGAFRVFAGLRSDPFYLAWAPAVMKKLPNLLQHDNVLAIVIEFDTQRLLNPSEGSLFGVIAETSPLPGRASPIGMEPPRFDWVGRPEQTNMRLNNPAMEGADDLRDLWNQQTPFAIAEELQPVFHKRLVESLGNWDMRDGKEDWSPGALNAAANIYLDDFLLFDVSKPINDTSFFEIEKSTLHGQPYKTGGGRTINANVVDIMITWMVNNDREFMQGGAKGATQPGLTVFPYEAPPNMELQTVADSVDLSTSPDQVWSVIGQFGGMWHPLIAKVQLTGEGVGQLRTIETIDGKEIIERLEVMDNAQKLYRYTNVSGIGAVDYTGTLDVKPKESGSSVEWRVEYLADGQPDFIVKTIVSTLLKAGFEGLKKRFGASQ
jgi:Polyketide cyclase / dehydrase and lipid transport/Domain of unknown function (DUF4331)